MKRLLGLYFLEWGWNLLNSTSSTETLIRFKHLMDSVIQDEKDEVWKENPQWRNK
jgi:hypothetical protein